MSKSNNEGGHTNKPRQRAAATAAKPPGPKARPAKKNVALANQDKIPSNSPTYPLPTNDTMEVHHHPQLEHNHKPWREYLLEGFMIFIAVMMGFIAENIREDITNNSHATQLTLRLVHDLRADTAQLNNIIKGETSVSKSNDTLITLLQQPLAKTDFKQIQRLLYKSHSLWLFYPSNGAINAIKNELHLKQFSNSDIITYIADYEGSFNLLRTVQDITLQYQRTQIDPFLFDHFKPASLNAVFSKQPPKDAGMRNLTQQDLTRLANCMILIRINTNELVRDNKSLKNIAIGLIKYVKDTYHPED